MLQQRPFHSLDHLFDTANTLWWTSSVQDWFEAFSAHPKIGDANALKEKFSKPNSWEGGEQSGTSGANEDTLQALQQLNEEYFAKNGFIFLICATGKSADEMLAALRLRLANDRETEIQIAAGEQNKITKLRLVKLLQSLENKGGISSKL
jgi:2-oxo-4-hydroxy-4-carboxy-5-ureidoimidazoline decarboxylase